MELTWLSGCQHLLIHLLSLGQPTCKSEGLKLCWWIFVIFDFNCSLALSRREEAARQIYTGRLVVGVAWFVYHTSQPLLPNFHGVKKCEIWPHFSTLLNFEPPTFRNRTRYLKQTWWAPTMSLCPLQVLVKFSPCSPKNCPEICPRPSLKIRQQKCLYRVWTHDLDVWQKFKVKWSKVKSQHHAVSAEIHEIVSNSTTLCPIALKIDVVVRYWSWNATEFWTSTFGPIQNSIQHPNVQPLNR